LIKAWLQTGGPGGKEKKKAFGQKEGGKRQFGQGSIIKPGTVNTWLIEAIRKGRKKEGTSTREIGSALAQFQDLLYFGRSLRVMSTLATKRRKRGKKKCAYIDEGKERSGLLVSPRIFRQTSYELRNQKRKNRGKKGNPT